MNIGIVYFTFSGDQELIRNAIQAVDRLRIKLPQHSIYSFILDDAQHPLEQVPSCTEYHRTTFDRRGNLNGAPCVKGMLEYYSKFINKYNLDWIVKTDSDCYINNLDWILDKDPQVIGSVGTLNLPENGELPVDSLIFHSGACYALSRKNIELCRFYLYNPSIYFIANKTKFEDHITYKITKEGIFKPVLYINIKNSSILKNTVHLQWYDPLPFEQLSASAGVCFKKWKSCIVQEGTDPEKAHIQAVNELIKYVEFMKNNK